MNKDFQVALNTSNQTNMLTLSISLILLKKFESVQAFNKFPIPYSELVEYMCQRGTNLCREIRFDLI